MSRTYRDQPHQTHLRHPHTLSELKQREVVDSDGYRVSQRHRYIPTAWDDITATSVYQNDHN